MGGGGVASRLVSDAVPRSAISVLVIMISPRGSPTANYGSNKLDILIGSLSIESIKSNS
jgi:hypothetical protein